MMVWKCLVMRCWVHQENGVDGETASRGGRGQKKWFKDEVREDVQEASMTEEDEDEKDRRR